MTNEITTINRAAEVAVKNQYMTPRKARIYTQTSWDNMMPNMVGLSIFIEAENNGNVFRAGKTKAIEDRVLPRIRASLDKFGAEFTQASLINTTDASFKSLLNEILENVLSGDNKDGDE